MDDGDKLIVKQLLAGNKLAMRKFYTKTYPRLLAYVSARVKQREDAEEIVQDSFLGMLDALPLFGFRSSLWTFLVGIAKHEIADYFRKLYAKKAIKYVPFMDQVYVEPLYSGKETAEVFWQAMGRIKPAERALIEWKYEQKLSVVEIAEKLGVGVKAAESKLFRARRAFSLAYIQVSPDG